MSSKEKVLPGINIQFPWSQKILNGEKTVETRSYAIPSKYVGKELAIIETPSPNKEKGSPSKGMIVGVVVFAQSFQYTDKAQWIADIERHRVDPSDKQFAFTKIKPKFGWPITKVERLKKPSVAPTPRGIVFASKCKVKV